MHDVSAWLYGYKAETIAGIRTIKELMDEIGHYVLLGLLSIKQLIVVCMCIKMYDTA